MDEAGRQPLGRHPQRHDRSWPNGIAARGEIRNQFAHVIDVAPTVLEAAGIPEPTTVHGVTQRPYEGTAMNYSFEDADAAERHETQYFEMLGNRGDLPQGLDGGGQAQGPLARVLPRARRRRVGALRHRADWTQSNDLAAEEPERLAHLQRLFLIQAARFNVLPMDIRSAERMNPDSPAAAAGGQRPPDVLPGHAADERELHDQHQEQVLHGDRDVTVPDDGADGVLIAQGGAYGGWSVLRHGRDAPLRLQPARHLDRHRGLRVRRPNGRHELRVHFAYDGGGYGKGGNVSLFVDDDQIGEGRVQRTIPYQFSFDETVDVGCDLASPVSSDYGVTGNEFTGELHKVRIVLGDDDHSHLIDDEHRLQVAMMRQ